MNERFGVVRGPSSGAAYLWYALLFLRSRSPDGTVWQPDPLDEDACMELVRRDEEVGDWILRYSWRPPERAVGAVANHDGAGFEACVSGGSTL
jgi:hypothetical protein